MRPQIRRRNSILTFAKSLSVDEIQKMKELFNDCDLNKDGVLNRAELRKVMNELHVRSVNVL